MPKPIPPPPPQPSEEETRIAVRWTWRLLIGICLLFFGFSQCYHPNSLMMSYGRKSSMDWVLWKVENLNMEEHRAHNNGNGKIIWLVGSSILRESLDTEWINDQLEQTNSEYRVVKLSMNRGNAGLAFGLLKKLQIQKDDIVIHNLSMNNFKTDWLEFSNFNSSDLMRVLDQEDLWDIDEWNTADKLEQASALPPIFWRNHETYMNGLTRWFTHGVVLTIPSKPNPRHHLSSKTTALEQSIQTNPKSKYYIPKDGFDFSDKQFNISGLTKMASLCNNQEAQFVLFYIPPRQQYLAEMVHSDARDEFERFLEELKYDLYYFPQLPENDYYDLTHPNFRGRDVHNQYFIDWIAKPKQGNFPVVSWDIPEYNK